jgi:hypothetical protein
MKTIGGLRKLRHRGGGGAAGKQVRAPHRKRGQLDDQEKPHQFAYHELNV